MDKKRMKKNRVVFLDLNGTIVNPVRVNHLSELKLIPRSIEALKLLSSMDYLLPVVTVQSRIAKGLFSYEEFISWYDRFFGDILITTNLLSPPMVCPHLSSENCECSKPNTKLYRELAERLQIDLKGSYVVGDTSQDIKAARALGIPGLGVKTGWLKDDDIHLASFVGEDLYDIAMFISKMESTERNMTIPGNSPPQTTGEQYKSSAHDYVQQLIYQIHLENWAFLTKRLCDISLIKLIVEAGLIEDLENVYSIAVNTMPASVLKQKVKKFRFSLMRESHHLRRYPELFDRLFGNRLRRIKPNNEYADQSGTPKHKSAETCKEKKSSIKQIQRLNIEKMLGRYTYFSPKQSPKPFSSSMSIDLADTEINSHLARILWGHHGNVTSLSLSRNGIIAVSGSADHQVIVWDILNAKVRHHLEGHQGPIKKLSLSKNSLIIASVAIDGLRVWRTDVGKQIAHFPHSHRLLHALSINSDRGTITAVFDEYEIYVFNIVTKKSKQIHCDSNKKINSITLSSCGDFALLRHPYSEITMLDIHTNCEIWTIKEHFTRTGFSTLSTNEKATVAVSAEPSFGLMVWDLVEGRVRHKLPSEMNLNFLPSIALSPNGQIAALSSFSDRQMELWDIIKAERIRTIREDNLVFRDMSISDNGIIISHSMSQRIWIWDISKEAYKTLSKCDEGRISHMATSKDCKCVIAGRKDGTLHKWRYPNKKSCYIGGQNGGIMCLDIDANGRFAVSASEDNRLMAWRASKGFLLRHYSCPDHPFFKESMDDFTDVSISDDGKTAISAYSNGIVSVWDLTSLHELFPPRAVTKNSPTLIFHGKETSKTNRTGKIRKKYIDFPYSSRLDKSLENSFSSLRHRDGYGNELIRFKFPPGDIKIVMDGQGKYAVFSFKNSDDIIVWDLIAKQQNHILVHKRKSMLSIVISQNGKFLLLASRHIEIWDMETGEKIRCFKGHDAPISCLAIDADNTVVVSVSHDGILKIWNLETLYEYDFFCFDTLLRACFISLKAEQIVALDNLGNLHFFKITLTDKKLSI